MDEESMYHAGAVARFDQTRKEACEWGKALVELRQKLRAGGFSSKQAFALSRLWFGEHLCHELTEAAADES